MQNLISITSTLLLTLLVIEIVLGDENEIFEVSDEIIREEYYDVFAEHTRTSEEVQLACSSKCVQVGENCTRFNYQADHKACTVTKLKREKSGGHAAPLMRYFHRKPISVKQEKQVSPLLKYLITHALTRTHSLKRAQTAGMLLLEWCDTNWRPCGSIH